MQPASLLLQPKAPTDTFDDALFAWFTQSAESGSDLLEPPAGCVQGSDGAYRFDQATPHRASEPPAGTVIWVGRPGPTN